MSDNGLVTRTSAHATAETTRRLLAAIEQRGLTVFARIDHAANAAAVNMPLRPTVFGAAKGGTPLMQEQQTSGLDLPLKVLVWDDPTARRCSPTTILSGLRSGTDLAKRVRRL